MLHRNKKRQSMMISRSKKRSHKGFARTPRLEKCVWCETNIDLNWFDYVVDGSGQLLHQNCFSERLGIINENRKKRAAAE